MERETPMLLPADLRGWVPADVDLPRLCGSQHSRGKSIVEAGAGREGTTRGWGGPTAGASEPPPPKDSQQVNFTDPDSALMGKSRGDSYEQAYNAQAAVNVGDSRLILGRVQRLRQFLLRGLEKVRIEWDLTCLAYSMRRMWRLAEA